MLIKRQLIYFLIIGLSSTLLAYIVYRLLMFELPIPIANALAYISGVCFSFFLNKKISFSDKKKISPRLVLKYVGLYSLTLIINVIINTTMLKFLSGIDSRVEISFLLAIFTSTLLNFTGLKYFVFR